MSAAEQAVIEAAIEWSDMRRAARYIPVTTERLDAVENALEEAISDLHAEHDGRYQP